MPMPLRQSLRVGSYLMRQKLARNKKFPLLVELEPLFACNLKCAGCGKIQQPHTILKQRMPVEQAIGAVEESGAPMVSITGGEPLMHPQIDVIVSELIKRKKFVFLCTNALLLPKKLDKFKPSPYFAWVVHIDGLRERHDESVCKDGVFDEAVAAIKLAKSRGFKVNTNTTVFNTDTPPPWTGRVSSTWPSRCRPRTSTRTPRWRSCRNSSCPPWPNSSRPPATPRSPSSSLTRERPRATFGQESGSGALQRDPRRAPGPAWCWPAPGPIPAGRTRWKAPCAVAWLQALALHCSNSLPYASTIGERQ